MNDSAAGNSGNSFLTVRTMVASQEFGGVPALLGELVDGALRTATGALGLQGLDQPGPHQPFDGRVQRAALHPDHLVLAPPLHQPLHLVRVHRRLGQQHQHHQHQRAGPDGRRPPPRQPD